MPVRGKHGKPKSGFPPFPPPLEIRENGGIPTFPPLRRRFLIYKFRQKNLFFDIGEEVGQIKMPKWAKISCHKQSSGLTKPTRL